MVNQLEIKGRWNEVKGKLQKRWGQLTEDDLGEFQGNANELVGVIQRKTGESRQKIEDFLDEIVAGGASTFEQVSETAREYAHQASERLHESYDQAVEGLRGGYEEAAEMVRRRPAESLAVVFGAGLVVGLVVGLTMRSR
jgi:uncharacterized protein YjbJ (UPF0337 family)